ncbi:DUF4435 domain-containing protein [Achromobacter xylosoxidans]
MSVFMRTPSGLRNFARFHGAELTIYIEGKSELDSIASVDRVTYDELYYRAVLKDVASERRFVFKVVGCKESVVAYAKNIRENDIKNCFAIVDRDWEGLISSWLRDPRLVHTNGYSWENDFWTLSLVMRTLADLLPTIREIEGEPVRIMIERASHRLGRISKIDCLTKLHGEKFIPGNKNTVGVNPQSSAAFLVDAKEIKKYGQRARDQRTAISACSLTKAMHPHVVKEPSERIVRGHLWEFVCIYIVAHFYKFFSGEKSIPRNVIRNASINAFSRGASQYLSPGALSHYRKTIGEALAAAST